MVETKSAFDEEGPTVQPVLVVDPTPTVASSAPAAESEAQDGSMRSVPPMDAAAKSKMVASGATGAVFGFLFGGPIISALLGFSAAYVSQKGGAPGDAARALGDVGISVRNKAAELDEKHNVVKRSTKAVDGAWEKAKEYDKKHNVLEQTKDLAVHGWQSFVNFIRERRVLERGVECAGEGYEFVVDKVGGTQEKSKVPHAEGE